MMSHTDEDVAHRRDSVRQPSDHSGREVLSALAQCIEMSNEENPPRKGCHGRAE